jgi:N-methylhydantoinase A
MNPASIAGGTVPIDATAAQTAIQTRLGARLGLSIHEVAFGIHQVADATMTRAIRAVTTERGRDPREFTLIAFGGSGPVHAATLADNLGMSRVYIPLFPGVFSALGLLVADLRSDYVQSVPQELDTVDPTALLQEFDTLLGRAEQEVRHEQVGLTYERLIDLRYQRQSSELTLTVPAQVEAADLRRVLAESFHAAHERTYGYRREDDTIAIVSVRLKATVQTQSLSFSELGGYFGQSAKKVTQTDSRRAYFGPQQGELETRILSRGDLLEQAVVGPLIVEEFDTTVVVPPQWQASVDAYGNIVLSKGS